MVLMAMGDWDQAVETAQRVLAQDPQNIEALRLITLFLLSQAMGSPLHSRNLEVHALDFADACVAGGAPFSGLWAYF